MDRDPRGTISQQGNVMRIDNAFVEEVLMQQQVPTEQLRYRI